MEILIFLATVLLVRVGMLMYLSGLARSKNAAGTVLRTLVDVVLVVLSFWAVGASLAGGEGNGWASCDWRLLFAQVTDQKFYTVGLPLLATGVIAGAAGERARFWSVAILSLLMGGVILPIIMHWQASGWLEQLGYADDSGACGPLLACAVCALVISRWAGPRNGKYHRDGSASMIPGHNLPLAMTGLVLMWLGWIGFIGVTDPHVAPLHLLLAGSAGAMAALLFAYWRFGKADVLLCGGGLLAGAMSMLPAGSMLPTPVAVAGGALAGLLATWATIKLDTFFRIDDPSGLIVVQSVGAKLGLLLVAVAGWPDYHAVLRQAGYQILGMIAISALAFVASAVCCALFDRFFGIRSSEADEYDGLDLAEHEINAYPDFQQTMIKSYHMREA